MRWVLPRLDGMARLLEKHRGRRNHLNPPLLTAKQILDWADAHFLRTGQRPHRLSGPIEGAPGESWDMIEYALRHGRRGLGGKMSLFQFLVEHGWNLPAGGKAGDGSTAA